MTKLPLALLAALPVVACVDSGDNAIPETADEVSSALEKDNGGFTTADEAPEFGTEAAFATAAIEGDAAESDAMAPQMADMQSLPGVRVRTIVMLWGQLPVDPDQTEVRDWSGRLELNRGGMLIRRKIAFELATGDRIVPRTDKAVIEFVSHTRPAADGLVLEVVDPAPGTGPLTLTYTPADGSGAHTLALRDLADGPVVEDAGNGNKIIVSARDLDPCDHGFMRGRWRALTANGGVYLGVVGNELGEPIGHVRGIWGTRKNGEQAFFGKFIDRDGHFRGILAGHWENGAFDGRWITRAGDHGQIRGLYFHKGELPGGAFLARWGETSCTNR